MIPFRCLVITVLAFFLPGHVHGKPDTEIVVKLDELHSKCEGIDIRELSIEQSHAHFESGKLTSKQLTECYLKRIEALNPILKAVIEVNPDAVSIADGIDKDMKATGKKNGPLCGIPILLEDIFGTNDKMETTAGAVALVGVKPKKDADIVTSLRAAGAVILGKANMAEFAFARGMKIPHGWSSRGGQGLNPYNLKITTSESSSGSAVATATNLCMASLGAETDAALISPSALASCVGLRASHETGILSMKGTVPITDFQDMAGPIARTVKDAASVLDGMVAPGYSKKHLDFCGGSFSACLSSKDSKIFKVGIPRNPFWTEEHTGNKLLKEETPILQQILDKMSGIDKEDVPADASKVDLATLKNVASVEGGNVLFNEIKFSLNRYLKEDTITSGKIRSLQDIIDFYKADPGKEKYDIEVLGLTQGAGGMDDKAYKDSIPKYRGAAKEYLGDILKTFDAIAVPCEPRFDTQEYANLERATFNAVSLASVAGFPTITVPAGYDKVGAPFGICFIGKLNSELELLKIGKLAEEASSARKKPQFLDKV